MFFVIYLWKKANTCQSNEHDSPQIWGKYYNSYFLPVAMNANSRQKSQDSRNVIVTNSWKRILLATNPWLQTQKQTSSCITQENYAVLEMLCRFLSSKHGMDEHYMKTLVPFLSSQRHSQNGLWRTMCSDAKLSWFYLVVKINGLDFCVTLHLLRPVH